MNLHRHINLVKNTNTGYERKEKDFLLVEQALKIYPTVELAQLDLVSNSDYSSYITSITPYDQFYWEQSHKGDKENIYAYAKIKVGPSWLEQLWFPVFERIKNKMEKVWAEYPDIELVNLQDDEVVQYFPSKGYPENKDVDIGLGIISKNSFQRYIFPIIVGEVKGGHFCKTTTKNVRGIFSDFRKMNPNIRCFAITDNNFSVSTDADVNAVWEEGSAIVIQRGNNKKIVQYPALNYQRFKMVEDLCVNYLSNKTPDDFLNITKAESKGLKLRSIIDSNGFYISDTF